MQADEGTLAGRAEPLAGGRRSRWSGGAAQLARRAGWNTTDQVISSLSNFALGVLVARQVSAGEYGAFALSFALYGYVVAVSRLLVSQPLAVRFSGASTEDFTAAARESVGAAMVAALLPGAVIALVGVLLGGTVGPTLLLTAVLLPGLLLQDAWRTVFFAWGRPRSAAVNDAIWGVGQIGLVFLMTAAGWRSALAYLLAWGLGGCVAAALGALQAGFLPAPHRAWRWLTAHWDLTRYFVSELVAINGSTQLMLSTVAAIGGLPVIGALRGAQVLAGPVQILSMSGLAFGVPELARRPWLLTGRRLVRSALGISGVVVVLAAIWGGLLLLLPAGVGRALLGDTWTGVDGILVPTVVGLLAAVSALGATCGIHASASPRVLFRLQLVAAPAYLVGGVVGVLVGGLLGAAVGIALAHMVNAAATWTRLLAVSRRTAAAEAGR